MQISVFTTPDPLWAGAVDVSVFVQDAATGQARLDVPVHVRAYPANDPARVKSGYATAAAASNKLFRAIVLDLNEPGRWLLEVEVDGPERPIRLDVELNVGEPLPPWRHYGLWIAWPALAVGLFAAHQWLLRRAWAKARCVNRIA